MDGATTQRLGIDTSKSFLRSDAQTALRSSVTTSHWNVLTLSYGVFLRFRGVDEHYDEVGGL